MMYSVGMLLLTVCVALGSGDWEVCGPGGSKVTHLSSIPGALFAAVERPNEAEGYEYYKSINGSGNWEFVSNIDLDLDKIISDTQGRLLGWRNNTIILSSDMGESWSTITMDPVHDIQDVASDPVDELRLFAADYENDSSPLLVSTDGGSTWDHVPGIPVMFAKQVEFSTSDPDIVYMAGKGTSHDYFLNVFKSTDGGLTWVDVSPVAFPVGLHVRSLAISPFDPDMVFIGADSEIFRTVDGGENWSTALETSSQISGIVFHPTSQDSIFAFTSNDVYHSGNGGLGWWMTEDPCDFWNLTSMAVSSNPEISVHIGSNSGLAVSTNGGYAWSVANNGIPGGSVYAILEDSENGFPLFSGNGFFLEEEQYSWTEVSSYWSINASHIARSNSDPDLWFAAGGAG